MPESWSLWNINVCMLLANLVMKQASYQTLWCSFCGVRLWKAQVVERDLLRSKVKLICFVDTLMTLASVNIKPALLFSLLEQIQALAWSIMLTIHEGWVCDCVLWGINTLALSPWGVKALLIDGRSSFGRQQFSPSHIHLVRVLAFRQLTGLCCL